MAAHRKRVENEAGRCVVRASSEPFSEEAVDAMVASRMKASELNGSARTRERRVWRICTFEKCSTETM